VKMGKRELEQMADWLGVEWSTQQRDQLLRYEAWLLDEAMPAGGLGPGEGPRLFDRHIADSLAFLPLLPPNTGSLVDVGSGVGLPAIPIAIARPEIAVTILDRSERRTRLAGRALRILGLENAETRTADAASVGDTFQVVTFRASLGIDEAVAAFQRLAGERGIGLFAWSRVADPKSPPDPPDDTIFSLVSEGSGILTTPAWIVRMQRSQPTEG
jgi:16S rRNA (guanine527-N7)-methyltransferase